MVLICISLIMSDVEHAFMFVSHLYVFFGEISIQVRFSFEITLKPDSGCRDVIPSTQAS